MGCKMLEGCSFYNDTITSKHGIGMIFKKKYCNGNFELCARYKVAKELGGEYVPLNLYPNMMDIAVEIIEKVKTSEE